jgi:hypothetical protein
METVVVVSIVVVAGSYLVYRSYRTISGRNSGCDKCKSCSTGPSEKSLVQIEIRQPRNGGNVSSRG